MDVSTTSLCGIVVDVSTTSLCGIVVDVSTTSLCGIVVDVSATSDRTAGVAVDILFVVTFGADEGEPVVSGATIAV